MADYYLNLSQSREGDYEVHEANCYWLKLVVRPVYLGNFSHCYGAVNEAKRRYPSLHRINGCKHCSPLCHTS